MVELIKCRKCGEPTPKPEGSLQASYQAWWCNKCRKAYGIITKNNIVLERKEWIKKREAILEAENE